MIDRVAFGPVSWYAILIVLAVLTGERLSSYEARKHSITHDTILDVLIWGIPLGILFARIYYVFFRFNQYVESPISIFFIRSGGLAIYGGIFGGFLAVCIVCIRHRVNKNVLLDCLAPSMVLGQAIGRWGNYINMEAYGLRVNETALQFFPFAVEIPIGENWYWHMATFFYEFCLDIVIFLILWFIIRNNKKKNGDVFYWYLLLYTSGRTVIEGLRNDSLTFISDFVRISQVISALIALSVILYFFRRNRDSISFISFLPVILAILSTAETFIGEFERNAYSDLFIISQVGLIVILVFQIIMLILWTADCGHIDYECIFASIPGVVFIIISLIIGIGRNNEDNTYYVTLRQFAAMIEIVSAGYLLCYHFSPGIKHSDL